MEITIVHSHETRFDFSFAFLTLKHWLWPINYFTWAGLSLPMDSLVKLSAAAAAAAAVAHNHQRGRHNFLASPAITTVDDDAS